MNASKTRGSKRPWLPLVAVLGLAAGAAASAADNPPSITLKYEADDLVRTSAAEDLYRRIRLAARRVCSSFGGHEFVKPPSWQKCYAQAVDNAVAEVHQPTLTALHQSRVANPHG